MADHNLYDPRFVRNLFDEMAATYGVVNLISSFGFARRWRRQCVQSVDVVPGEIILDLMAGMGELWPDLSRLTGHQGQLIAVDISPNMCERGLVRWAASGTNSVRVLQANALACPLERQSVDCIFSTFGLKTFSSRQLGQLASEVNRLLRPGGRFAFLEISVPPWRMLRWPYLAYIDYVIPLIGKILLGNPDNYRLLGRYTTAFGNCREAAQIFEKAGLEVRYRSYFFGCASGICGFKQFAPTSER